MRAALLALLLAGCSPAPLDEVAVAADGGELCGVLGERCCRTGGDGPLWTCADGLTCWFREEHFVVLLECLPPEGP